MEQEQGLWQLCIARYLTFQSCSFCFHHAQDIFGGLVTYALNGAEQHVHGSMHVLMDCVFYSAKKEQHSISVLPPCETLCLLTTNTEDLLDFHHKVWTVVAVFVNLFHTTHIIHPLFVCFRLS